MGRCTDRFSFLFFFARAKLSNVLWVAKMRDGVRVPRCSRSDIQKFHRAFGILINRGSADRLRRDNQFSSVPTG